MIVGRRTGDGRGRTERKGQGVRGEERGGKRKKRAKKQEAWRKGRGRPLPGKQTGREGKTGTKEGRKESIRRRKHSEKTVAVNVLRAKRNRAQLPDHRHVLRQPRCQPAGATPPAGSAPPRGPAEG